MNAIESTKHYKERIEAEINNTLTITNLHKGTKNVTKLTPPTEIVPKLLSPMCITKVR